MGSEGFLIYILSIEKSTVHGITLRKTSEKLCQVNIRHIHTSHTAHSGLDDLRIIHIRRITTAEDTRDAEPISNTDNGAKVAGVLHSIESKIQLLVIYNMLTATTNREHGKHLLRMLKEADLAQLIFRNDHITFLHPHRRIPVIPLLSGNNHLRLHKCHQISNDLRTFCRKSPVLATPFLGLQRADILYLVLAYHTIYLNIPTKVRFFFLLLQNKNNKSGEQIIKTIFHHISYLRFIRMPGRMLSH